jgi:DnaK suppressor protein
MALTREQGIELGYVIEDRHSTLLDGIREDDQPEVARELEELRAIEAARKRFSEGNYGVCLDCGGDIDYRRLRAYPAAIRCIDCQRRHEKTHANAGGSSL